MKLVYLPVDSRPCNARFPIALLHAAGIDCDTPPMKIMDHFTRPSDTEAVGAFITQKTRDADALILAVDQLAYGSLLASREEDVSQEEAMRRVRRVAEWKRVNPRLRIIAFNTIMRSSIGTLCAGDLEHHFAITAYSQAAHRAMLSGDPSDERDARRVAETIPEALLSKYHKVRSRNHAVNRACVDLCGRGVIDRLLLLQEDSQPFGFHKLEQAALEKAMAAQPAGTDITLHNGTDEGGCLCAAAFTPVPLKLHISALGNESLAFTAKYEDRPFMRNIESHCRFAGITLTDEAQADKILCVLTPGDAPQKDALSPQMPPHAEMARLAGLARELASRMGGEKPVGLLDVYYANGGMLAFMEALSAHADPLSLCAYAAWNTASNALGTTLAQLALGVDPSQNRRFTAERLLDDLLYEGGVRHRLQTELAARDEDVLRLADAAYAGERLSELMGLTAAESPVFSRHQVRAKFCLPWPRTFEIDVRDIAIAPKKEALADV